MIGVSIVTFRSDRRALVETLRALAGQSAQPNALRLHANASSADEAEELRAAVAEACPGLPTVVTVTEANLGFSGPHNAGLEEMFAAGCRSVLVLNPDLMLAQDAIAELRAAASADERCLYGPLLELADPGTFRATGRIDTIGIRWTRGARHLDERQGEPTTNLPTQVRDVPALSGACLLVPAIAHREIVEATGEFFDEDFFAYREDAELGYRAALLGVPSRLVPAARGLHVRRLRGTSRRVDPLIDALGVRNRFLFAFKYGRRRPGSALVALGRDVVVVAGVVLRERSSLHALREAWVLRPAMRAKRRRLMREVARRRR